MTLKTALMNLKFSKELTKALKEVILAGKSSMI